jgi:hypothetical protein
MVGFVITRIRFMLNKLAVLRRSANRNARRSVANKNTALNNLIIHSAYLPPLAYFVRMQRADTIRVESCDHYSRQTLRNRCVIMGPNRVQALSVPVVNHHGRKTLMRDARIDYSSRWQQVHWRTIEAAYNKSPFFSLYREEFEPFWLTPYTFLFDLNMDLLSLCLELAEVQVPLIKTEQYILHYEDDVDLRPETTPADSGRGLNFPRYIQVFEPVHGFVPNLSIIDLLFNRGPQTGDYLESVRDL